MGNGKELWLVLLDDVEQFLAGDVVEKKSDQGRQLPVMVWPALIAVR